MLYSNSFDVKILSSVEATGQQAWDNLAKSRAFASYRWYRFGETVLADDTPIYILLSRHGETVARATLWLTRQEPLPIPSKISRYFLETLLRRWPLLLCRTPWWSGVSGLILPDPPLRYAALRTITQVAWDQAQHHQASFLVFDNLERDQMDWSGWPADFVPTTISNQGTRLVITWADFESYLRHLSRSMRKDYRRHRNRASDLGIRVGHHSKVTRLDEALKLIQNVERRHRSSPNPWARRVLQNADMVDFTWLTAEIDGRLVGCGLLLGDEKTRFLTLLGLDYDVRYVYFQLIYEAIRCAIGEGVRVLRGGSGAYRVKARLGFDLEHNNYVAFTANNRVLRWVGQLLSTN